MLNDMHNALGSPRRPSTAAISERGKLKSDQCRVSKQIHEGQEVFRYGKTQQKVKHVPTTVDTDIKVKLIPRYYSFAFAFVIILLIGQMTFQIYVDIDASPRVSISLSLSQFRR